MLAIWQRIVVLGHVIMRAPHSITGLLQRHAEWRAVIIDVNNSDDELATTAMVI